MKVKVSEAEGAVLDKLVNMSDGLHGVLAPVEYSTRWEFGGPIIERGLICLAPHPSKGWSARLYMDSVEHYGATPLIAAMRCYVASKLGDFVTIPEEVK